VSKLPTAKAALGGSHSRPVAARPITHDPEQQAILQTVIGLAPLLAEALRPGTEILIHDFSKLPNSVVAIEGNISGRSVGSPITGLLLRWVKAGRYEHRFGYAGRLADGRPVRSSTIFIRDPAGNTLGSLCINMDISGLTNAHQAIEERIRVNQAPGKAATLDVSAASRDDQEPEQFPLTIDELARSLVEEAILSTEVEPALMQKSEKLSVVAYLEKRGYFMMRDSVEALAERLSVSRHTIYNYLSELQ